MNPQPIIGYDAKRIVRNATGLGSYGRTLINDLAAHPLQLRLYARGRWREPLVNQLLPQANITLTRGQAPSPLTRLLPRTLSDAYWRTRGILSDLRADGVQLFHGLSGELPLGISKSGIKSVVTIHDLIFLRHPEYYHWADTKIYAWKFRQAVREADHVIAISACTKRDILAFSDIDERKVSVIYQSCAPKFTVPTGKAPASPYPHRYILSVGTIEPRKNTLLAVKALHWLPDDLHLVLVGRSTPYADEVRRYAEANGLAPRVTLLHGVSDSQLPAIYAGAEAFVYPSRYEGFGIPIIEAIRCGLPVVAATGSCLEEAGGPDALYVNPDDPQALSAAIRQVLRGAEGREQRIQRSHTYIQRFDGQQVASQMLDLYQQLL